VQTDEGDISGINDLGLNALENYHSTASSLDGLITTTLFGVPEIYQDSLSNKRPVLLALPVGLGMPVSIHFDESLPDDMFSSYQQPLSNNHNGLHLAFLPASVIEGYVTQDMLQSNKVMIATGYGNESSQGMLYSNMSLSADIASTEDLAPTIMNALGCAAPTTFYSTGQNLLNPSRKWLVSTSGERIVVFHNGKRTDVLSNGSYEITDVATGKRSNAPLNVDLLSQAIKHLSRFSNQN
jgi:hypothetical protein